MRALRKDFFIQIKKTISRFISILLIVALGSAFYAGIRSTEPDMRLSADKMYDEENLMDIRIMSTMGLTDDDIDMLAELDSVDKAVGSYYENVIATQNENQCVVKALAYSDEVNVVKIAEGRLPEAADECIVDTQFADAGYEIGSAINLDSENLSENDFTIVGTFTSSYYLTRDRETASIGNGDVEGVVVVLSAVFTLDYYTDIYVLVAGAKELTSYTDEYDELIQAAEDDIEENIEDICIENRYNSIVDDAYTEINDAQAELDENIKDYDDALKELTDAKAEYEDGVKELADAKEEVEEGEKELAEAKKTVAESEKEHTDAKSEYEDGVKELAEAKEQYNDGLKQYNDGVAELEAAKAELEAGLLEYNANLSEYESSYEQYLYAAQIYGEAALSETKAALDVHKAQLDKAKEELDAAQAEIDANEKLLEETKATLDSSYKQIQAAQTQLEEAKAEIEDGERKIVSAKSEIAENEAKLAEAKSEIEENEIKLEDAAADIEEAEVELSDAKQEIDDAQAEIDDARADVEDIEYPEWYVLDRDYIQSYTEYGQESEKIGNIGAVVPVIFFVVAAMVSLNTMTRMINEDRMKIGTLKALGYGSLPIALTYTSYGFLATMIGAVGGGIIGSKLIPYIIIDAYKIMYVNLGDIVQPINALHFFVAVAASIISVMGATILSCITTLKSSPAQLMRPEAPKQGKRVLLERVTFIWKRLNFQQKSTVRNLFRYKKRLFMTLFGISGCMSLIVLGFGVRDSINYLSDVQYSDIIKYDISVSFNDSADDEEIDEAIDMISKTDGIEEYMRVYSVSTDMFSDSKADTSVSGYVVVPENPDEIEKYVRLESRTSDEQYKISDDGAVISEKLAKLLDVGKGDTIYIKDGDNGRYAVTVEGIFENYVYHYVYISPALYSELYGKTPEYNSVFINGTELIEENEEEISESFLENEAISSVMFTFETQESFGDILGNMDIIVVVLVVSAGLLAFVVLFNLNNINIAERKRELATLKVLGFYDNEVSAYIYRENVLITLIGIAIGAALGDLLHKFIIVTTEIDIMMFGRQVYAQSFLFSAALTLAFAVIINLAMHFKLKKIDMATSLKSVE